jgi:hypothetical protein
MKLEGSWIIGVTFALLATSAHGAALVNGDFEDDPAMPAGWTTDGLVSIATRPDTGGRVAWIRENPGGEDSNLFQVFDIPPDPVTLSFEFFMTAMGPCNCGSCTTAPDAFLVYLTDPTTGQRLVVPPGCAPDFPNPTPAIFWRDNLGAIQYCSQNDLVTVAPSGPGSHWTTVTIDVSSLGGQSVHLEFGMVDGCDGRNTSIFVDNVIIRTANSPPQALCMDTTLPSDG